MCKNTCFSLLWHISDTEIGVEELGHLEMVGAIVHQLTRNMTEGDVKRAGLETYFVDHTAGVYTQFASGTPWTAATFAVKGDVLTDLVEDMAADGAMLQEQRVSQTIERTISLVEGFMSARLQR